MSTYYYLVCEDHDEGLFITDNKGNPPEPEFVKEFFVYHPYGTCNIILKSEHDDFGRVDWAARVKKSNAEFDKLWASYTNTQR